MRRCSFSSISASSFPFEINQFVLQKLQSNPVCCSLHFASEVGNVVIQRGQMTCIHFKLLCIYQLASYIQNQVG